MMQGMDSTCSTIAVAAVVILFCMGYVEYSKMRPSYGGAGAGTCGMKSGVSARRVSAKVVGPTIGMKPTSLTEGFTKTEVPSMTTESSSSVDSSMFEWNAPQAETEKFMPKGPKKTTSPFLEASHTLLENPMNFKNVGVKGRS